MQHYARLILLFIKTSFQQETAFRANFAINLLTTVLNLGSGIVGILILFSQVETIQGWTFEQTLVLLGVYLFVVALRDLVFGPSMGELGGIYGEIWNGRFDYTLIKPIHTQFLVSVRKWRIWSFVDVLLSLVVMATALIRMSQAVSWLNGLLFIFSVLIAIMILYAILLFLASVTFWLQGVPLDMVFNSLIQMGRYPIGIYPNWLRLILTWIIPIGFITTVPVQLLTQKVVQLQWLTGFVLACGLLIASSYFFRSSLRHYASASS